jgi:hypothetical protein
MPVPPTSPQGNIAILVIVLLVVGLSTIYWRLTLRLIAIVVIALAAYGLIISLHGG